MNSWAYMVAAVALTTYGQLVTKWQTNRAGAFPTGGMERAGYVVELFLNPWMISGMVAALAAAIAYVIALTDLDLSRAYPFMSLSFALVLVLAPVFFSETMTVSKVAGVLLILIGVYVGSITL